MKREKFINVGYGNFINFNRVVAVFNSEGSAAKRLKENAREKGILYDATQGRKTRSLVILDTNQIFLTSIQPETLISRIESFSKD